MRHLRTGFIRTAAAAFLIVGRVGAVLAQDDEATVSALLDALLVEESFRVKNKIVDGILARGWSVPEERREAVRKVLPPGYTINGNGTLNKRD